MPNADPTPTKVQADSMRGAKGNERLGRLAQLSFDSIGSLYGRVQ